MCVCVYVYIHSYLYIFYKLFIYAYMNTYIYKDSFDYLESKFQSFLSLAENELSPYAGLDITDSPLKGNLEKGTGGNKMVEKDIEK